MKFIHHPAASRGKADHGWLLSYHTFSFANFYDPQRMQFGMLRVLNDDQVAAGRGFGSHPHQNMEIISIPLEGDLEHKDDMGNITLIKEGDIQVMSAGTGLVHSEYNKSHTKEVKFLQIWVIPNKQNVSPRYGQQTIPQPIKDNELIQILSPNPEDEGVWIHQQAWFHLGTLSKDYSLTHNLKDPENNGLYLFVLEGKVEIDGHTLERRDGFGLWDSKDITIAALQSSKLLVMEVPMNS
ncbi:hypothetical protein GCM10007049_05430 [Echinicola pacifica]|uniref:Pirin family protein n=1 Tax=Echinicola pacifica TaxID=346377 RepID=A0A918PPM2_9BACT|nr:pirin family protein [Echinicola pacifica]GGZ16087.1 hypothetical protein GCM10007049_05430 [Echinicola pacifica]